MTNPVKTLSKLQIARVPLVSCLLLIVGFLALHALSLRSFPAVFVDEAIMISRAWAWLETGLNFGPLESGVFEKRFDGYWTFNPLIPTWFHALFVSTFGLDLSLLRLSSLLCGAALLVAVFFILLQLSSSYRCALIAVLLVVTSSSFLVSSHLIRYDILVAALGFGAIAVYLAASRRDSVALAVLSGLLLGMGFEVHVNAVIYGPVIVALALSENGLRFLRQRVFWGFAAGAAVALAWYLWAHVIRYPEAYFGIGRALAGTHFPPLVRSNPLVWITAFTEMTTYVLESQFRVVAALLAALMLLKSRMEMTLLVLGLVATLSFAIMIKSKMYYYFVLIQPFSDIILAVWIEQLLLRKNQLALSGRLLRLLVSVVLAGSLLLNLLAFWASIVSPPSNEATPVAARIETIVPKEGSIMAAQTYWFDLHRFRYISWQNILAYRMYEPESSFQDAMSALRPDVLVLDDHLRQFILPKETMAPQSGLQRYFWERRLPKADFEAFLASRATLKDRIETIKYGVVEIYSINWSN